MNNKQKKELFDIFYKKYQMYDKMIYIKKVMDSCTSINQLENTVHWGQKILWSNYDMIHRYIDKHIGNSCSLISVITYAINRTKEMTDELSDYYSKLLKRL